ncbi:MAG: 5'/3'-nucleotidase SurE [Nitrososphaeria archaeon]
MILVSNDDGPASPGLRSLIRALSKIDEVRFSIPEGPRSGSSMSLTFHKPIRIREAEIEGARGFICSGSPADAIVVAHIMLDRKPDVVATGINLGDNTGLQDIYSSGTVAGALQAAILGYRSVAFSKRISDEFILYPYAKLEEFEMPAQVAARIVGFVLDRGLPSNAQLLNVNFPVSVSERTPATITRASPVKYEHYLDRRLDPRGRDYYWLWGKRLGKYPEGTDAHAVFDREEISITPMRLDLSVPEIKQEDSSWYRDLIARIWE